MRSREGDPVIAHILKWLQLDLVSLLSACTLLCSHGTRDYLILNNSLISLNEVICNMYLRMSSLKQRIEK